MASEMDELLELLRRTNIQDDIRYKGLEYILGLTATEEGINTLLSVKFIPFVLYCINKYPQKNQRLLHLVYRCIINISSSKEGANHLLNNKEEHFVPRLLHQLCDPDFLFVEPICYILNNLYCHGSFFVEGETSVDEMNTLTKFFLSQDDLSREKYRFLGLVFANMTNQVSGRRFFLKNNSFLSDVFSICANSAESFVRRLGISFMLRNCCLETEFHEKLLKELNILPNLLLPLMGGEEYEEEIMDKLPIDCQYLDAEKKREENPTIRKTLVQALCLLCYTEEGWNYLKEKGVYYAIRELHHCEKEEHVVEAIETLILYMLVENYSLITKTAGVTPSETDIIKDLPDFLI